VDCAKFATGDGAAFRAKHGIPSGAFLALNISRIDAQKNQMLALEAFAKLRAQQSNSFLILIGPETQPDYAKQLRDFISANNLAERVKILPGMRNDNPELIQAFHACDVFVLPSMHEPFGIVVLEAWSSGKPVIASRIGGLQALVRDGETGFFIDPNAGDAAADLAAKLNCFATEPDLKNKIGANGLREANSKYDWAQIGQQLETLYQRAEENCAKRK
jgi:glycosyltransferase involved in cell wall biosynthesis